MFRSLRYMKPYKWTVLFIFIFIALRALFELVLPQFLGIILDDMVNQDGLLTQDEQIQSLIYNGLIMLIVTVISIGVTIYSGYLESRTSSAFGRGLRGAIYEKVSQFSLSQIDEVTSSSLITRTTTDIQELQLTMNMLLRMVVLQPFLSIGAIVMSIQTSSDLAVIIALAVVVLLGFITMVFILTVPKFRRMRKLVDKLNLVTRENLTGLKVVRAFNTQSFQAKKTTDVALESKKLNLFVNRVFNLMWPVLGLIMGVTTILFIYFALEWNLFTLNGDFTAGDLSTLILYANRVFLSFMMLTMIFIMFPRAQVSASRIMEVIDMEALMVDGELVINVNEVKGNVQFKNVDFSYPNSDEPVLENISFTAKAGEITAFIGSTGSGKSTLINLIPRFYNITNGEILIDNININDLTEKSLHNLIGYVPQQGLLFKGDVLSNVSFGQEELDLPLVEKAIDISQSSFVYEDSDGINQEISQGGSNVSGGQRQRLSIARAIAKNPKLLIFDDSFSALDYQTDLKLRKAIKENIDSTILIVAQRVNTIKDADQIVVLDKGKIVGTGKHMDLLQSNEIYREIAESQLSKEELANE